MRPSISLLLVALASIAALSGGAASHAATGRSAQIIVVTHDRFRGHVEPDVAVNPRNPRNLIGACQFELGPRTRLPGTFASFDGGRTWHDNGPLPLPAGFEQGADTTVAFTATGVAYVAALMSHGGKGFASRVSRGGIFLWRTTAGGRTFSQPIRVYVGAGFQDHPWLAVRNTRRGAVLLVAWTNSAGLEFTRSRPASTIFSRPRLLVAGALPSTPVLALGPDSRLDVFFQDVHFPKRGGKLQPLPTRLIVIGSNNDGATFASPQTVANVILTADPASQQPPPLLAAAADATAPVTAVAIAAQDPRSGHPVIEFWLRKSARGRWHGPSFPTTGATASMAQEQPRLAFTDHRLYLSYFTISRTGQMQERLASAPEQDSTLTAQQLAGRPFTANKFVGDYQALALTSHLGYALWNSTQTGRLDIVEARFPVDG